MRHEPEAQRERGQKGVRQRLPEVNRGVGEAARRKPAESARKQKDHHDPPEEVRQAHADERRAARDGVLPAVAVNRGPDAERHRAGERDRHRQCDDERARLDLLNQQIGDRGLEDERASPVPGRHAADPPPILNDERIVEAKRLAQTGQRLRVALRAHDHGRDVAGKNGRHGESDHGDEKQRQRDRNAAG